MKKKISMYFFPLVIIAIAARLFFYPWDFEMTFPVWIGTLLIMIFGICTLFIMVYQRRNN